MKTKYIGLVAIAISTLTACDLDVFPTGSLTPEQMAQSQSAPEYATAANYAFFKDEDSYAKGEEAGNTYIRHYFQAAEYPSDNATLSGRTEDVLYEFATLKNYASQSNLQALWYFAYKVISGANGVIATVKDGASKETDQLKGENYFLRAIAELHLVTLYAHPYSQGRENPGIVLKLTADGSEELKRATVGDTYDQIVKDLENAIRLMTYSRGNKGYATKEAAQGLLTRVYLYMGENQKCVDLATKILGNDPTSHLEYGINYDTYFANAKTSKETLWCVALEADESKGQEMMGSMWLKDGVGWGEVYSSDPLNTLYERYPTDRRYASYVLPQYTGSEQMQVSFPRPSEGNDCRLTCTAVATPDGENYTFKVSGKTYTAYPKQINGMGQIDDTGEYTQYYVDYEGETLACRITPTIKNRSGYTFLLYYVSKFGYQDDDPMLCSPVMIRWAEVILNRAEANAKLGNDQAAYDDVNILRTRADIPEQGLFSATNKHGYTTALDVVLDERRLELAYEGHRMFDLYRNGRSMDRRFAGVQPWEVILPTDNRTILPIPTNEVTVSHIAQNPGY